MEKELNQTSGTYFDLFKDNGSKDHEKNSDGNDFQNLINNKNDDFHSETEETDYTALNEQRLLNQNQHKEDFDSGNQGQMYMRSSMFYIAFSRSIWLIVLLFVQSISSIILSNFSELLKVLSFFFYLQICSKNS